MAYVATFETSTFETHAPRITVPALPTIPLRQLLPFAILAGLLMMLAIYFVGAEQGATSLINNTAVHEFTHDARHLLAFPCH